MKQKALGLSPHTEMGSSEHLMRYGYVGLPYVYLIHSTQEKECCSAYSALSTQYSERTTGNHWPHVICRANGQESGHHWVESLGCLCTASKADRCSFLLALPPLTHACVQGLGRGVLEPSDRQSLPHAHMQGFIHRNSMRSMSGRLCKESSAQGHSLSCSKIVTKVIGLNVRRGFHKNRLASTPASGVGDADCLRSSV